MVHPHEAAKQAVDRLRAGEVPEDFPDDVDPVALGIAHEWRTYLALGAIGPDIAALFPDFRPPVGSVITNVLDWYPISMSRPDRPARTCASSPG